MCQSSVFIGMPLRPMEPPVMSRFRNDHPDHLPEAERRHGQVDARQAQGRHPDHQCHRPGSSAAERQGCREGPAEVQRQQRGGVGADAHEGRVAEREQAAGEGQPDRQGEQRIDADR